LSNSEENGKTLRDRTTTWTPLRMCLTLRKNFINSELSLCIYKSNVDHANFKDMDGWYDVVASHGRYISNVELLQVEQT